MSHAGDVVVPRSARFQHGCARVGVRLVGLGTRVEVGCRNDVGKVEADAHDSRRLAPHIRGNQDVAVLCLADRAVVIRLRSGWSGQRERDDSEQGDSEVQTTGWHDGSTIGVGQAYLLWDGRAGGAVTYAESSPSAITRSKRAASLRSSIAA